MNLTKIAGVVLAVVLVAGGTAAALPNDAPTTNAPDTPAQAENVTEAPDNETDADANETERGPHAMNESERGPPADRGPDTAERGPPTDMPEQVPDFVTEIHETINTFLSGELDGDLGSAIAEITPDDGEQSADDTDGDMTEEYDSETEETDSDDAEEVDEEESDADEEETDSDDADDEADSETPAAASV